VSFLSCTSARQENLTSLKIGTGLSCYYPYLLKVNKHWLEESLKKESNTVKGARKEIIECSPLLVTNVKKEITSLWPNSNICLQIFISVVVTFIIYLLNALYFMMKYIWNTAEIRLRLKSYPRVSEISLFCTFSGVWFYFSLNTFHRAFSRTLYFHCWSKYSIYPYTSARQQNHVRFTGKYMLYSLCQPPPNSPCFSFLK
jgi:hypothetical protein